MNLDTEAIKQIIPHRKPFLWIDTVKNLIPGKHATAYKQVTGEEDFFKGHFPGAPVMPGVLIVEAMAQAGAVAILSLPQYTGRIAYFAGIEKVRFRNKVFPGDIMRFEVEITKISHHAGKGTGIVYVEDRVVCQGELLFVIDVPQEDAHV